MKKKCGALLSEQPTYKYLSRLNAEIFGIRAGSTCSYHWSRKRYTPDYIRTVSTLQDQ